METRDQLLKQYRFWAARYEQATKRYRELQELASKLPHEKLDATWANDFQNARWEMTNAENKQRDIQEKLRKMRGAG